MTASFNTIPLLSVKPELDSSLAVISRELENFFAGTRDLQSLISANAELHRMKGVLQILPMRGLVVFCDELEKLLQELFDRPQDTTPMRLDAIRRALFGVTHYLDAIASGAPNATLRLFHEYQEMHQARGLEMAFEVDLFFPDLQVELPSSVLSEAQPEDTAALIKSARVQYQKSLLKWLRKEGVIEALRGMMAATQVVLICAPQDRQRSFWWVAGGLLNCVLHDGVPPELQVNKALSRIDQRMRALLEKCTFDEDAALSEMLYLVARSHTVSKAVEDIKQVFNLDTYLPEVPQLPPSETAALLDNMRALLAVVDETWERCVAGDVSSCAKFSKQSEQLYFLSEKLDRNTLQFLCKQIHTIAANSADPDRAQRVALDMAMSLLLLNSGIDHYQQLGSGFHEQARILSYRLQQDMMRLPDDPSKLENLVSLYCEMEQREVMAPLANEIQHNLQQIEQYLNTIFDGNSKRLEFTQINRLLSQAQGGFRILSLDVAEQLLTKLRLVTEHYQSGNHPSAREMRVVASAVSILEDYVHGLTLGQKLHPAKLSFALQELNEVCNNDGQAETHSPEAEPVKVGVSIRSGDEDAELLEVFLEEAQEVMETLRANLEISRLHLDSREPWVTIRRGFHTLKGSGRMVGLTELGEVAWAVERAMNKWLAENKPASPILLEMVGDAEVLFQHWVDMLKSGSTRSHIDTSHLLTLADCLENDKQIPQPAPPALTVPPETPAEPTQITVGTVIIDPVLFRIATEEAAGHVRDLHTHLANLQRADNPVISYDFMRAAHTLAGVNRTMGFWPIVDLAYTLEQWLETRIDIPGKVSDTQFVLLNEVISQLDAMCASVINRVEPQTQVDLMARLLADKDVVTTAEAPAKPIPDPVTEAVVEPAQIAAIPPEHPLEELPIVAQMPLADQQQARQQERAVHDEVDPQLLPIFLEEAHELYPQIGSILRAWREQPGDAQLGRNLQRCLHTLKGSARMAGAMRLGELTHHVEDRVSKSIAQNSLDDSLWNELDNYLDRIANAIDQLHIKPENTVIPGIVTTEAASIVSAEAKSAAPTLEVGAERAMHSALLRVRSDTVDRLVNEAGEISVARSRVEAELREFRSGVLDLSDSVNRLRKQLREIEIQAEGQMLAQVSVSSDSAQQFDPLEFDRFTRFQELTRFMNESVHDVQTVQQALLKNLDETAAALSAQSHLNRDLQQGLMGIRMVPFASISERLYRIVRQTGKELGKRANLELSGTEIELDRSVLEKMTAPFEHLLRNAIAHGLEAPEQRVITGKAEIGEIRLSLRQESNEVIFELSDDGAGLNIPGIRQKALDNGIISSEELVSDEQVMQLIFTAGLSTAREVTEISGRGVGLDVVRSEISALGGRVDIASVVGQGARFSIHLPLTLAVTKTLLVRAGQTTYAVPSTMVEHVQQLKPGGIAAIYKQHFVDWQGNRYELHYLPRLLGDDQIEVVSQPHNPVLLLRGGDHRIALHVDALLGNQEVVVKNIGPQLARLPGIAGATVSSSGAVILIINPVAFTQRIAVTRKIAKAVAIESVRKVPLVMVVDDSLTVRKVTGRLLERAGYQVLAAKDGVDALEQLKETTPNIMLLDIEMPRMDGFELTKRLREDSKTRGLPIIMITSRTAEKHRDYALELGVNEYLGKPYKEDELLQHIARFINLPEMG